MNTRSSLPAPDNTPVPKINLAGELIQPSPEYLGSEEGLTSNETMSILEKAIMDGVFEGTEKDEYGK